MNSYCVRLDDNEIPRTLWRVLSVIDYQATIFNEDTRETVKIAKWKIWVIL
jgi:hypothetical protein